jgi:hypothetical protein
MPDALQRRITVEQADALSIRVDVLVLKHAQHLFGLDSVVASRLGVDERELPPTGEAAAIGGAAGLGAREVIFLGTRAIADFDYSDVRDFGRRAVEAATTRARHEHVATTVHGPGFGLDEAECFRSLVAGLLDALPSSDVGRVTVLEANLRRADRFRELLAELLPPAVDAARREVFSTRHLELVGRGSRTKPSVFVAMPFAREFGDRFHYGIERVVEDAGYLCERADLAAFTGDVMTWVRDRIDRATLVVADLSSANANVYLEVGYAWGKGIPAVLLVQDSKELKFDVQGQRCLVYESIQHLEELLRDELSRLPIPAARRA